MMKVLPDERRFRGLLLIGDEIVEETRSRVLDVHAFAVFFHRANSQVKYRATVVALGEKLRSTLRDEFALAGE